MIFVKQILKEPRHVLLELSAKSIHRRIHQFIMPRINVFKDMLTVSELNALQQTINDTSTKFQAVKDNRSGSQEETSMEIALPFTQETFETSEPSTSLCVRNVQAIKKEQSTRKQEIFQFGVKKRNTGIINAASLKKSDITSITVNQATIEPMEVDYPVNQYLHEATKKQFNLNDVMVDLPAKSDKKVPKHENMVCVSTGINKVRNL